MQLPFLTVIAVIEPVGPGISRCVELGPGFIQGLCLCSVMVEIAVVHYRSLPLDYCQETEQSQLTRVSVGVMMVVHAVVLPAILRN